MKENIEFKTAAHVALLAPVPLKHLTSALVTLKSKDIVLFGSDNSKLFKKLESLRTNLDVDVYIYASHCGGDTIPETTWHARYIGIAPNSSIQAIKDFRPASTAGDTTSKVYWQVTKLELAKPHERHKIINFSSFGKNKAYSSTFIPRGPLLIEHPQ